MAATMNLGCGPNGCYRYKMHCFFTMTERTIYSRFKSIAVQYAGLPAVIEDDRTLSYAQLDRMASQLTDYMIPEYFVKMDEIPITRRGKVKTSALPVVMKEGGVR